MDYEAKINMLMKSHTIIFNIKLWNRFYIQFFHLPLIIFLSSNETLVLIWFYLIKTLNYDDEGLEANKKQNKKK